MKKSNWIKTLKLIVALYLPATAGFSDDPGLPAVLPVPQKMIVTGGSFRLTPETRIYTDAASRETGEYLATQLRQSTGCKFEVSTSSQTGAVQGAVCITTANANAALGPEGYELTATADSVVIRAPQQAGCFYGVQTLLQLLPPEVFATQTVTGVNWTMPCVRIEDQPRFKWRGMMLDVSRHFFSKEEVKTVLDELALHKINTFHWHLVDDQGWRIEIKKYPRLTEVGAWRKAIGFGLDPQVSTAYGPDGRYGGFYTQDDIRDVVAYAAERHITVIPEIEMPGHSVAALAAYPEFSCTGQPQSMDVGAGVFTGVYCAGNDGSFEFLQNVLTEVFELFPSKYIHIGGDEVRADDWKKCPLCQARMQSENLKNEHELQSYFIRRMETFINAHGKTLIGWSEIRKGGLAPNATVMDWIGGAVEASTAGHDVVMAPNTDCYFNHYPTQERALEPRAQGLFLPLHRVYGWEPIPGNLDPAAASHILGAQACLWTEFIASPSHLEYMMFPRLVALSEGLWSPKASRNWDDFNRRLQVQYQRFDQRGINYRRETAVVLGEWTPAQITTQGGILEYDVTRQISAAGTCHISLDYLRGKHGLNAAWAALLEDGLEISRDSHAGFAGGKSSHAVYQLGLPTYKAGARYTVRLHAAGRGGTDSFGRVSCRFHGIKD